MCAQYKKLKVLIIFIIYYLNTDMHEYTGVYACASLTNSYSCPGACSWGPLVRRHVLGDNLSGACSWGPFVWSLFLEPTCLGACSLGPLVRGHVLGALSVGISWGPLVQGHVFGANLSGGKFMGPTCPGARSWSPFLKIFLAHNEITL